MMHVLLWICFNKSSFGINYSNLDSIDLRKWRISSFNLLKAMPTNEMELNQWIFDVRRILKEYFENEAMCP